MTQPPVIVLGAGLAGWTTVREFRKLDATTPVTLITADSGDFYAKPSLSNALAQRKTPAQLVSTPAARMAETLNVTLLAHTRVSALDTAARQVVTPLGRLEYSRLVVATGAQPIRIALGGDAADAVQSVNSLDDFAAFHARLTPGARVLIMGAGLIGCEFANDLAAAGHPVTVVDPGARPLAALLPAGASTALSEALQAIGVQWLLGCSARAVHRSGAALQVQLVHADGSDAGAVTADVVLSAVGLRADTGLAQAAGIACDRGIRVDDRLQTSASDVYALGDAAQYASAGDRTLPYVMPIMAAARTLAAVLAGQDARLSFALMPVAVKTPALPVVVASPAPGTPGEWHEAEPGLWQYLGTDGVQRGFVLTGKQTARRQEQALRVVPA